MRVIANYENGLPNGSWKSFYNNGKIESQGFMRNGEPQGSWTYHFRSGVVESKGEFNAGKKVGIWEYYNNFGKLIDKIDHSQLNGAEETPIN